MSPELQASLRKEYPLMFGISGSVVEEYGIEINDGWYTLLCKVCELISVPYKLAADAHKAQPTEARRAALEAEKRALPRLSQVKEKFGSPYGPDVTVYGRDADAVDSAFRRACAREYLRKWLPGLQHVPPEFHIDGYAQGRGSCA